MGLEEAVGADQVADVLAGGGTRFSVRADGESYSITLGDLLADNEGSPAFCARVRTLGPGEAFSFGEVTVRRHAEGQRRGRAKVRNVPVTIKGKPMLATVTVDRRRLLFAVRLARRRTVYELPLADVAELVFDRVSRANAGVGRLKGRRRS